MCALLKATLLLKPPSVMPLLCQYRTTGESWCAKPIVPLCKNNVWVLKGGVAAAVESTGYFMLPTTDHTALSGNQRILHIQRNIYYLFIGTKFSFKWYGESVQLKKKEEKTHPQIAVCGNNCVKSYIWYGKKKGRNRGTECIEELARLCGCWWRRHRAVSAFTFYTKDFRNVSQRECRLWKQRV